jgi:hypothetical protein
MPEYLLKLSHDCFLKYFLLFTTVYHSIITCYLYALNLASLNKLQINNAKCVQLKTIFLFWYAYFTLKFPFAHPSSSSSPFPSPSFSFSYSSPLLLDLVSPPVYHPLYLSLYFLFLFHILFLLRLHYPDFRNCPFGRKIQWQVISSMVKISSWESLQSLS